MKEPLNILVSAFDRAVSVLVGNTVQETKIDALKVREGTQVSDAAKALYSSLSTTDVKTTAILQHVSIMIAVSGVLYSITDKASNFRFVFGFELLFYVLLTLFCVRMLIEKDGNDLQKEAIWKERLYYLTAQLTLLLTGVVTLTIFLKLVLPA